MVSISPTCGMISGDMSILIVAATESEVEALMKHSGAALDFLFTGVGMTATAFSLGSHLAGQRHELAINLGIAGSFDPNIGPGSVVEIGEDTFAELGAEDGGDFLPLSALGFGEVAFKPSTHLRDLPGNLSLPEVRSITVNTVHGNEASIKEIRDRWNPQLESMEGAAFFYACHQMNLPCLQIRAVSNFVERRNRASWQIGPAIQNLNNFAMDLVDKLAASKS